VIATPWLKAVVHNYILRFRRRDYSHRVREGRPLETVPEPAAWQPEGPLESNELLDRLAALLPKRERSLLALIRRGYSLPEASRWLGVPPGSPTTRDSSSRTGAERCAADARAGAALTPVCIASPAPVRERELRREGLNEEGEEDFAGCLGDPSEAPEEARPVHRVHLIEGSYGVKARRRA